MLKNSITENIKNNAFLFLFFSSGILTKFYIFNTKISFSDLFAFIFIIYGLYVIIKSKKFYFHKVYFVILGFLIWNLLLFFFNKNILGFNLDSYFLNITQLFFFSFLFIALYNLLIIKKITNFLFYLLFWYALFSLLILFLSYLKIYFNITVPYQIAWFGKTSQVDLISYHHFPFSDTSKILRLHGLNEEPSLYGLVVNSFLFICIKKKFINFNRDKKKFFIIILSLINTFSLSTYILMFLNILFLIYKKINYKVNYLKFIVTTILLILILSLPFQKKFIYDRLISINEGTDRSAVKRINVSFNNSIYNLKKTNFIGTSIGNSDLFVNERFNGENYRFYRTFTNEYVMDNNMSTYAVIFFYVLTFSGVVGLIIFCFKILFLKNYWSKIFLVIFSFSTAMYLDYTFWSILALFYTQDDN
jgi:hypothetical protein